MKIAAPKLSGRRPGDNSLVANSHRNRTVSAWTEIKNDVLKFIGGVEKKGVPESSDERVVELVDAFNTYRVESHVVQYLVKAFLKQKMAEKRGKSINWPVETFDISEEIQSAKMEKKRSEVSAVYPSTDDGRNKDTYGEELILADVLAIKQIKRLIAKAPKKMDGGSSIWTKFNDRLDELDKKYVELLPGFSIGRIPTDEWIALRQMVPKTDWAVRYQAWTVFADESMEAVRKINEIVRSSVGDWKVFLDNLTSFYYKLTNREKFDDNLIHEWERLKTLVPKTIEISAEDKINKLIDRMIDRSNEIAKISGKNVSTGVINIINHMISEIQIRGETREEANWKSDMTNLPKSVVIDIVNSIKSGECDVTPEEIMKSPEEREQDYFDKFYEVSPYYIALRNIYKEDPGVLEFAESVVSGEIKNEHDRFAEYENVFKSKNLTKESELVDACEQFIRDTEEAKKSAVSADSFGNGASNAFSGTGRTESGRIINSNTMRRVRYARWLKETGRKWLGTLSLLYRVNHDKPESEILGFSMKKADVKNFLAWCYSIGVQFTARSMPALDGLKAVRSSVAGTASAPGATKPSTSDSVEPDSKTSSEDEIRAAKIRSTTSFDDQLKLDGRSVKTVLSTMRQGAVSAMTAMLADTERWLGRIRKYVYGI